MPQIELSRTHPRFLEKLFEMEVPEIAEGIVEIVAVARDPGIRAKISVRSHDSNVDPVGTCVGVKGARVQNVIQELRGERQDIVVWSEDPVKFVCNALAPARVSKVIVDKSNKSMDVVVADDQLSLAIGRRGQNVRLVAKLTGWKIDVRSEGKDDVISSEDKYAITKIKEVDETMAEELSSAGYKTLQDISKATVEELIELEGIDDQTAELLITKAKKFVSG
jgi:N utilization substance protein A